MKKGSEQLKGISRQITNSMCWRKVPDHCIRFALSFDDVHYKSACDHDHTMQCDRCLDCKKVADEIIAELESKDISYR